MLWGASSPILLGHRRFQRKRRIKEASSELEAVRTSRVSSPGNALHRLPCQRGGRQAFAVIQRDKMAQFPCVVGAFPFHINLMSQV